MFEFNKNTNAVLREKLGDTIDVLTFGARDFMDDFVPMRTGALAGNVTLAANGFDRGYVRYNQNYASKCFYAGIPNFRRDKHPLATSFWDRAMMAARKDELVRLAQNNITAIQIKH